MEEEEIVLAFVEGFLRQAIDTIEETSGGIYEISFEISKTKIGGINN